MAVRTRPPPEGPRAQGHRGGKYRNPESENSLPGGLAAPLRTWARGRSPYKFPRPDWGEARKPPPPRAGPAQVKRRLRPPRSPHWKPRKPTERDAAFRLPTSQEGAGGAGSGWGRPAEDSTLAAQNVFSLSPDRREDAGKCSFVSSRKSACDGRGRAAGLSGAGRRPGGPRTTSPYSAGATGAGFALPGHRVREPVEGLSKPGRSDSARLAARRTAHCAAGPREERALRVRGVARDTAAAGSALCVFPNRGRTCLLTPLHPPPLLLAFPWRWL